MTQTGVAPSTGRGHILRPRLLDLLESVPPAGVATVVAPAGSGKSVLLAQWFDVQRSRRIEVIDCGVDDADPDVFARRLVDLLAAVGSTMAGSVGGLLPTPTDALGARFVDAFVEALSEVSGEVDIVIDDLHLVTDRAVLEDLATVAAELPANVRLFAVSRWDVLGGRSGLALENRLVDVRSAALAFTPDEARDLVNRASGRLISSEDAEVLCARTDGWAAGLQLAGVSLRSATDVSEAVAAFAGDESSVVEYLTAEVLDAQDPDVRDFLLRTSVAGRLDSDLCEALTGCPDGSAMIERLVAGSLPLVPVDREGRVYRYHHLFEDLLRYTLRTEDPDLLAELERAAARWCLAHNDRRGAIEHHIAVGDDGDALAIIAREGAWFYERNESLTLIRWLQTIEARQPEPSVLFDITLQAVAAATDQVGVGSRAHRRLGRHDLTAGERAASHALYACLGQSGMPLEESDGAARAALDELREVDPGSVTDFLGLGGYDTAMGMGHYMLAYSDLLNGRLAAATATLTEVASLPCMAYPVWHLQGTGTLALALSLQGACTEAERLARSGLELAAAAGIERHHVASSFAHLALAQVASLRDQRDVAGRALGLAALSTERSSKVPMLNLHRLLRAEHALTVEGPRAASAVRRDLPLVAVLPPLIRARDLALDARCWTGIGDWPGAVPAGSPQLEALRVDVHLARGDLAACRAEIASWEVADGDRVDQIERALRRALLLHQLGAGAAAALEEAVTLAEAEEIRQPFLRSVSVLKLLRSHPMPASGGFVGSLLGRPPPVEARDVVTDVLVERLTERERSVLEYLPTRMTNREIAAELFVSVNTLKTHLRSMYRKLDVSRRNAAIDRAVELGLL